MPKRKRISKVEWLVVGVILLILVAIIEPSAAFRYRNTWISAQTGSLRYSTSGVFGGLFGGESPWRNGRSALEGWMQEHDMKIVHDWQWIGRTGLSLIRGRPISAACPSDVPPITGLSPELLTRFVQSATEHQIREFVETFQGNDLGAQKRAIWTIMGDVGEGR